MRTPIRSIRISNALWAQAKAKASKEHDTVSRVIVKLLAETLASDTGCASICITIARPIGISTGPADLRRTIRQASGVILAAQLAICCMSKSCPEWRSRSLTRHRESLNTRYKSSAPIYREFVPLHFVNAGL
jgi:hypothetical protein